MGMLRRGFTDAVKPALASAYRRRPPTAACMMTASRHGGDAAASNESDAAARSKFALHRFSPLASVLLATENPAGLPKDSPLPAAAVSALANSATPPASASSDVRRKYQLESDEWHGVHAANGGRSAVGLGNGNTTTAASAADLSNAGCACLARAPPSRLELETANEPAIHALAEDLLAYKEPHLAIRPSWRPPAPPTPREVDELVGKIRTLAFPEYYSAGSGPLGMPLATPTMAAPSAAAVPNGNGASHSRAPSSIIPDTVDKQHMVNHLRNVSRTVGFLLQRTLIIDALDDDAGGRGSDEDLPEAALVSQLGNGVHGMSREEAFARAEQHAHQVVIPSFLKELAFVVRALNADVDRTIAKDVATSSRAEVALSYPGINALSYHRVAHALLKSGAPIVLARGIAERANALTGVDIHPAAKIGPGCFIDHGTGLVVGGTSEIGSNVTLFHNVTLGARSFPTDALGRPIKNKPRHPIVQDGASIFAGAVVLGRVTIGRDAVVAAGATVTTDVPCGHTVVAPRNPPTIIPPKTRAPQPPA